MREVMKVLLQPPLQDYCPKMCKYFIAHEQIDTFKEATEVVFTSLTRWEGWEVRG